MKPDLVSPRIALLLLDGLFNPSAAEDAIIRRAASGMIASTAKSFEEEGSDALTDSELHRDFWQEFQEFGYLSDWDSGDFSTLPDLTYPKKAMGVRFDRDAVLELLPPELRAEARILHSVMSDPAWILASQAVSLYRRASPNAGRHDLTIVHYCKTGLIAGRAAIMRRCDGWKSSPWEVERSNWDIPPWFWEDFGGQRESSFDFANSTFLGQRTFVDRNTIRIELTGVHFLRSSLRSIGVDASPPAQTPVAAPGRTGRPLKHDWEGMLAAMMPIAEHDGLVADPDVIGAQAIVIDQMRAWFSSQGREEPVASELAKRAKLVVDAYRQWNSDKSG